jgi:hypothetical protein
MLNGLKSLESLETSLTWLFEEEVTISPLAQSAGDLGDPVA